MRRRSPLVVFLPLSIYDRVNPITKMPIIQILDREHFDIARFVLPRRLRVATVLLDGLDSGSRYPKFIQRSGHLRMLAVDIGKTLNFMFCGK
jgi:hypothetical protein